MKYRVLILAAAVTAGMASMAKANTLYFDGFESGQPQGADFYDNSGASPNNDLTVVAGTLTMPAASGNNYAVLKNIENTYLPSEHTYGQSAYTDYGAARNDITTGPGIAISGAFYESTAFYINTAWSTNSSAVTNDAFNVDTTPDSDPGYNDETEFRVYDGGNGTIDIVGLGAGIDSLAAPVVVSTSGWYTFKTTFQDDGGDVENILSVIDSVGNVIGSFVNDPLAYSASAATWGRTPLPYANLDGTNYGDWVEGWTDGFANDEVAIDNVQVGTVPLPASAWSGLVLLGGLAAFGGVKRLRKLTA